MGYFTAEQIAHLEQSGARVAGLVDLEFDYDPFFLWNGESKREFGGNLYDPLHGLGGIEGMQETRGPVSQETVLTLSGVPPESLAMAIGDTEDVQGRLAVYSLQLLDAAWQAVANPIAQWFGIMGSPRVARTPAEGEQGGSQTIRLPCENLFYGRSTPPNGRYTDAEQQKRSPGDRFFAFVASLVSKTVVWPV